MDYLEYHRQSYKMGDIDPSNAMLVYIANRFEVNMEQRYWLAFLFSTCYCGPTTFYFYNEFPDFENVNVDRLNRFWQANKHKCIFQSDRLRVKTSNEFVPMFESYRNLINGRKQEEVFNQFRTSNKNINYLNAYKFLGQVRNVGRFTLFIYLELINLLTNFKCEPDTIDWKDADNCRTGLQYAFGEPIGQGNEIYYQYLDSLLKSLAKKLPGNIFGIETTLCAYSKYKKDQRYVGYYLDRQRKEIDKMKEQVTEGVCWRTLDQYRLETYKPHKNLTQPI